MGGDALLLALQLWHDPEQVESLRTAPLPRGLGELLPLLAGHPDRLAMACARIGITAPETLLQACRFFAHQVLLHPHANDARLLGLGPDTGIEALKPHHRALMLWLHPDRKDAPPDAAPLAARINAAYLRLTSPAATAFPCESETLEHFHPYWRIPAPEPRHNFWRNGIPVMVILLALCLLALWNGTTWQSSPPLFLERVALPLSDFDLGPADYLYPPVSLRAQLPHITHPSPLPAASVATPALASQPIMPAPAANVMARSAPDTTPAPPVTPPPLPITDPLRKRQARHQAIRLLEYLQSRQRPAPPIWHSEQAYRQAEQARLLLIRGEKTHPPRLRPEREHWRFGSDRAELSVLIEPADRLQGVYQLQAQLHWQDEGWWVKDVTLEPSP